MKKILLGWSSFDDTPKLKKQKKEKCVGVYKNTCLCMLFDGMDNLPDYCKFKEEKE
jgi:hypothetical protein